MVQYLLWNAKIYQIHCTTFQSFSSCTARPSYGRGTGTFKGWMTGVRKQDVQLSKKQKQKQNQKHKNKKNKKNKNPLIWSNVDWHFFLSFFLSLSAFKSRFFWSYLSLSLFSFSCITSLSPNYLTSEVSWTCCSCSSWHCSIRHPCWTWIKFVDSWGKPAGQ